MIVNWITHLPTPYRAPVYEHVQQREDLEIQLTERSDHVGQVGSQNRGADWRTDAFPHINFTQVRTLRLHWRDVPLYVLLSYGRARKPEQADVMLINGWEVPAYWQTLLRCKLTGTPVINFYESPANTHTFTNPAIGRIKAFYFRRFDAIVTPGAAATEAVLALGVARGRIFEGFNAVDVQAFADGATRARAVEPVESKVGWRYLYVGQLIERKRVVELLETFAAAAQPEDTLTYVGSGALLETIRERSQELGVESRVLFEKHTANADLPAVYGRHDALLLVSAEEVWGLVANEALAAGLRLIVTENCGVVPSIDMMDGVHVVQQDLGDLHRVLNGLSATPRPQPIAEPEILRFTPQAFAEVFIAAAEAAVTSRRRGLRRRRR